MNILILYGWYIQQSYKVDTAKEKGKYIRNTFTLNSLNESMTYEYIPYKSLHSSQVAIGRYQSSLSYKKLRHEY